MSVWHEQWNRTFLAYYGNLPKMDNKEKPSVNHENSTTENVDSKQKRRKYNPIIKEWLTDLSSKSSLQGFHYFTMRKLTVIEKLFWVITFLISIGLSYWYIRDVWDKWKTSPVIVSFSERMVPVGQVPFPSVTICPMRKALRSVYNFSAEFEHYIKELEPIVKKGDANESVIRQIEKLENVGHVCDQGTLFTILNRTRGNETIINDILEVSPKISDVLYNCIWRGKMTRCSSLFTSVMTWEGLCFNFNSLAATEMFNDEKGMNYNYLGVSNASKGWTYQDGYDDAEENPYPNRGREPGAFPDLEVILVDDLNDRDGMCNSLDRGYKVYLQHPADRPQTSLYYYPVLPNKVTSMAISFSMLSSSDSLNGYSPEVRQCYFPHERQLRHYRIYTFSNCDFECDTNHTFNKCQCIWYNMPFNDTEHYCTIESTRCYNRAKEELAYFAMRDHTNGSCNCLPACNSIDYDAAIVQSDFKLDTYIESMEKIYDFNIPKIGSPEYSKLEMYFKGPRFVSMHRDELFGLTDFLANCGGLLGLFLGFSFLSIIEIFYFMTLRLCCMLRQDRITDAVDNEKKVCQCRCQMIT